jgi:hypothetical protein
MKLIKLDAILQTNFKGYQTSRVENFTVVTADSQTKGKGKWCCLGSEAGKT